MATPRHHTPRSDRPSRGPQVGVIAAAKGKPLLPWQQLAADVALELDPRTGLYHYGVVVVSVPRQAGKTKLEGDVADHRCITRPRARVWLTMQTGKDAGAWMRDEHFPSLELGPWGRAGRAGKARWNDDRRAGSEGVVWHAPLGSSFRVFAPVRDGLHSKQSDLVFVDEAWAHTAEKGAELRQAIRPTMATRAGAQLWVVSTKGDDSSAYLNAYIDQGEESLALPNSRVCFIDYGIGDDVDAEDLEAVAAAHPAVGHTISLESLSDARDEFRHAPDGDDVEGWARAYGNRATRARTSAIPWPVWSDCGKDSLTTPAPARPGLAFDVDESIDGPVACLAAAWRDEHGPHVRLIIDPSAPTRELPGQIAAVARARGMASVGYDPTAPGALDIADAIGRADPDINLMPHGGAQFASACVAIRRAALDGVLRHAQQPSLDESVKVALTRRMLDGGIGWHRYASTGPIAALCAATIALRVSDTQPAAKRKPQASAGTRRTATR